MTTENGRRGRRPKNPQIQAEEEAEKKKMESEIVSFRDKKGYLWHHMISHFGFKDREYSAYSKIGGKESSYKSVKRFHDAIFDPTYKLKIASEEYGSYVKTTYDHYCGEYALIRPSISENEVIYGYKAKIDWDDEQRCHFLEVTHPETILERGNIYFIKDLSAVCIHFKSKYNHGILLLRIIPGESNIAGLMTTMLQDNGKIPYMPASIPAILVRKDKDIPLGNGYISKSHKLYSACLKLLQNVAVDSAILNGWWK